MSSPARALHTILIPFLVLCWTIGLLLLVVRWRLSPAEWPYAWPGPGSGLLPWPWPEGLVTGSVLAMLVNRATRKPLPWRLLLWPALPLAVTWAALPFQGPPPATAAFWILPLGLLGLVLWRTGPRSGREARCGWHRGRTWRLVHGLVLAVGVAVGLLLGGYDNTEAILLSLLLYPLYALVQLALVLALPWPWLSGPLSGRPLAKLVLLASLFALVHWPNPMLMVLTGAGMTLWAREYHRGRPLGALAVSMGLLATLAAQGLPTAMTDHMQVGPADVRLRAVPAVAAQHRSAIAGDSGSALRVDDFLQSLYPAAVGRQATPGERQRWLRVIEHERRCQLTWIMLLSQEARRNRPHDEHPTGDATRHWAAVPAPWPARIREHVASLTPGTDWAGFVAASYRAILGRTAGPAEIAGWQNDLSEHQYQVLTLHLLSHHRELARAPFDTLASEDLPFWR